jgi:hypothetical protein
MSAFPWRMFGMTNRNSTEEFEHIVPPGLKKAVENTHVLLFAKKNIIGQILNNFSNKHEALP